MPGPLMVLPENTPTWLVALAFVCTALVVMTTTLTRVVRHCLPQESGDRLSWWKELLAWLERRRGHKAAMRKARSPAVEPPQARAERGAGPASPARPS